MRSAKAITCKISRGGFSDERIFSFELNGSEYSGVASRSHMWRANRLPLEEGEPPIGQVIDGLVAARILEVMGEETLVSLPDGGVLKVPSNFLQERPAGVGQNVLV